MVLQNFKSSCDEDVSVGCMHFPSWQYKSSLDHSRSPWTTGQWNHPPDETTIRLAHDQGTPGHHDLDVERRFQDRRANLRRNLPSFRVLRSLGLVGVALIVLAYSVHLINPVEIAINLKMNFSNGSFLFELWKKPPVYIYVQLYIFNVTNPREFLRGEQKIRYQEIGPFVYREQLENTQVTFNDNDTISYVPRRSIQPMPEMSVADPTAVKIIVPNIALLGLASSLHKSRFLSFGFSTLSTYLDSQPFLHMTVDEFLWGFDDKLVHLASTIFPKWINFPKLGLLDRMFDEGDNVVTMNIRGDPPSANLPKADLTPPGSPTKFARRSFAIDSWNGSPGLSHWGYGTSLNPNDTGTSDRCNTIRGASEGILFPRDLDPDMQFSVYRKAFCRTLPLKFASVGPTPDNVPAYWYTFADDVFDTPDRNPDNHCYCRPEVAPCLPRGLSDLTPCYYDIPAAVSLPHFYGADERLLQNVEGLKPNKSLHSTFLGIQPRIGVPLLANIRVQTNLVIHNTRLNPKVQPFNNLTLPLFWIDLTVKGLPGSLSTLLHLLLVIGPVIQTSAIVILLVVGSAFVLLTFMGAFCSAGMMHASGPGRPSKSEQLFWKGKYSQVKMIPAVKTQNLVSVSLGRSEGKGRT